MKIFKITIIGISLLSINAFAQDYVYKGFLTVAKLSIKI